MTSKIGRFIRFVQAPTLSLFEGSPHCDSEGLSEGARYDSSCENTKTGAKFIDTCRKFDFDKIRSPAVICGMAGAVLVAMPATNLRAVGFLAWVGGNSLWVLHGRRTDDNYITLLFGFYLVTALVGLSNIAWGC